MLVAVVASHNFAALVAVLVVDIVELAVPFVALVAVAGTVIMGNNPFAFPFTYTGTGTMFTGVDANFAVDFVLLSAPNGKLFDFSSTTGNGSTFGLNIVTIGACAEFGSFDNLRSINITNVNSFSVDQGITVSGSGNWERLAISRFGATTDKSDFIALNLSVK